MSVVCRRRGLAGTRSPVAFSLCTEELHGFVRVAVPRRRGPAGLRDPLAVSLTALMGFTVLVDHDYRVRKKAHFVFMRRVALPTLPALSAVLLYVLMHGTAVHSAVP